MEPAPLLSSPPWWFVLGREPLLSLAELGAVFNITPTDLATSFNGDKIFRLAETPSLEAASIITKLGGTIKIGGELANNLTETELLEAMVREVERVEGKINFGISWYSAEADLKQVERWGKILKRKLTSSGRSARYIFKQTATLSTPTVEQNGLHKRGREFLVISASKTKKTPLFSVAKTIAIQPFASLSDRDYGRPGRDDKSGMLPPKLAMIMINLTAGSPPKHQTPDTERQILDPFCGSGTILTEALLLGYKNIIGSDLSDKAIADTQKNMEWIRNHNRSLLPTPYSLNLFQSDTRDLSRKLSARSVDAIITEPYLGPPLIGREKTEEIKKNCQSLTELYREAFKAFQTILKPKSAVVFIIPRFLTKEKKWITISDKLIPELTRLGFTKERLLPAEITPTSYLFYHRPAQLVGREIWKFRFSS